MKKLVVTIILFCVMGSFPVMSQGADGPKAQLKPHLDAIMEILVDPALKGDEHRVERRQKIMSAISAGFNFREMSKRILASNWNKISDYERDYFTKLMTKFLENVYIGQLEGYGGQVVVYGRERIIVSKKTQRKTAQVKTTMKDKELEIDVKYSMIPLSDKWLVYDIRTAGVSLVANYRKQFKEIINSDKFEGLIKMLEEKNNSFKEAEKDV